MIERALAIETSCDDTSVAIVRSDGWVDACLSMNQDLAHKVFGGVVPELASRNHTAALLPLIDQILKDTQLTPQDLKGLVVTSRPGLLGSLLVGVSTAKALALSWNLPFLGVHHLEGHILSPFLRDPSYEPEFSFTERFVSLTVSGGHTSLYYVPKVGRYELLGQTVDDAAGEAFDKFAKMIGLGYPGGALVDQEAKSGDPKKFSFPRGLITEDSFRMSFSGLKTAAQKILTSMTDEQINADLSSLCASFQEAIVDVLVDKLVKACLQKGVRHAVLAGGVSANSRLRQVALERAQKNGIQLIYPPLRYCTDNAAMIGFAGVLRLMDGQMSPQNLSPMPRALLHEESKG